MIRLRSGQVQLVSQQSPAGIHCGSPHTLSEQILLRKGDSPVYRPYAADSRCRHTAVCLTGIVLSGSQNRFQSILLYSRSCKAFHKQTCRGVQITIVFAFLADNAGIVPSILFQLDMYTDFLRNSCGRFSQFSCNGRKTFLFSENNFNRDSVTKSQACILSHSFLRFSAATIRRRRESSAPYPPKFIAFISGKAAKKAASVKMPPSRKPYVPLRSLFSIALSST